ncbi:MAG: leucine-rich repeat protein [Tannerella sp.]|nr:leucine-rich repeat protein [Tannerella sp.]
MKKLFLLLAMMLLPAAGFAQSSGTIPETGLTWLLSSGTLTISGTGAIPIPENEFPWADSTESITTVIIENGVTDIGEGAFNSYPNLMSVTIAGSITGIGQQAFYHCSNLTSVTISEGVTKIGNGAFMYCSNLVSAPIPNSVTWIGFGAFQYCDSLTSITIPAGVKFIYPYAFGGCNNLTSISVDAGNTNFSSDGGVLFNIDKTVLHAYPGGLSGSYTIPSSVKSIDIKAFEFCDSLTSVTIPEGVTSIGSGAFDHCSSLTSVTIPYGVTSLDLAFSSCTSLTSVTVEWATPLVVQASVFQNVTLSGVTLHVPAGTQSLYAAADVWKDFLIQADGTVVGGTTDGLTWSLSGGALTVSGTGAMPDYGYFTDTPPWKNYGGSITSVTVNSGVTSIGGNAFANCSNLSSVVIAGTVTSIGGSTFAYCTSLTSVNISAGVESIGEGAFSGSGLTSVNIPASVTDIGALAFTNCSNLTSITVDGANAHYSADGGVLFNKNKTVLVQYPTGASATAYTIPNSVTDIGAWAFSNCSNLSSITFPTGLTGIGRGAFAHCALISVTVPNGVTSIPDSTFAACTALTSVSIPSGVTTIGMDAFFWCSSLTSITIPGSVTSFGTGDGVGAFAYCSGLTDVTVEWVTPLSIPAGTFAGVTLPSVILHVPSGTQTDYDAAAVWTDFGTILDDVIIGGTTGGLTWSLSGDTLTVSGTGVMPDYDYPTNNSPWYDYSTSITTVIINNGVTRIGQRAFFGCFGLTSVTIPGSVTSIGAEAFAKCGTLTSVAIPNSVESIEQWAFNNSGLTSVTIPGSVQNIEAGIFSWCTGLTSISVDAGNTHYSSDGGVLFNYDKTVLVQYPGGKSGSYAIPNTVTDIVSNAFSDCSSLTSAVIPVSVTHIGESAFSYCTGLTDVTVEWATPLSVPANTFTSVTLASATLHVPAGTKALYEAATVWQDFETITAPGLSVSTSSLDFDAEGETQSLTVTANVIWSAVSSGAWTTVSPSSGSGNATVSITASPNTSSNSRTSVITFSNYGVPDCTVTVTQDGVTLPPTLSVSPSSLSFERTGGSRTFAVTSANTGGWTVTSSASWATVSTASGSDNATVTVTATANTGDTRTATVTVSGGGLDATVTVTQAAAPATLTVSATSLHFATGGGTEEVSVTANRNWTATASASWLNVSTSDDSLLSVTAASNTGYARTDTIIVTGGGLVQLIAVSQDAAQQIIAEPEQPVDGQGSIEIALEIPLTEQFGITFIVTLPAGFLLDTEATSLAGGLQADYRLSITPNGQGGWLFEITPHITLRSAGETVYREVVNIVYTTPETVQPGSYEMKLQNVNLLLTASETVIHQDEIRVPVRIDSPSGIEFAEAATVRYHDGVLRVSTPAAERIEVYSAGGQLLYSVQKAEGAATFRLNGLPRGVLIIRGGSGWTVKTVNSD